jgi:hypothetical protein
MEQIQSKNEKRTIYKTINQANKEFWETVNKSVASIIISIFLLLGSFSVFDMVFPEHVPDVNYIGVRLEKEWVKQNLNQTLDPESWTEEQRIHALQPSLKMLDIVCPEVSKWVRNQYEQKLIVYLWTDGPEIAKFDFLTRKLFLSKTFFSLNEGEKVKTLAHEYRHSIQNRTKFMKRVIYNMLTNELHEGIVEDDAELFEFRVHVALHE